MKYKLRFDPSEIDELARQYISKNTDQKNEVIIVHEIGPNAKKNGFYCKDDFLRICRWKTPRTQSRCAENDEPFLREVTAIALAAKDERIRIEILTLLHGVDWPTASVLLHFGHMEPYPILDFRALESLSIPQPLAYKFSFWWDYVQICREIADQRGVSMRTLDRALWQFSKNQSK